MSTGDSLGDRMKLYERSSRVYLPRRMPVIIRVDGKAWHTWARQYDKPFDHYIIEMLNDTAIELCEKIQGARLAFMQSDEISVLVHNYATHDTQPWFENEVQKMVSVSAAVASVVMSQLSERPCHFDARAFVLPESDVCNYFIWRQQDWTRNSIQMLARSLYSQKQCHGKNQAQLQEMIHEAGKNWNDLAPHLKRGRCIVKESYEHLDQPGCMRTRWVIDDNPPVFTADRSYIENLLEVES